MELDLTGLTDAQLLVLWHRLNMGTVDVARARVDERPGNHEELDVREVIGLWKMADHECAQRGLCPKKGVVSRTVE